MGIVDPAMDEFPGPEEFDDLLGGARQGVGEGGLDGLGINAGGDPAGEQAGNITSEISGGNAAAPGGEDLLGKGAQGSGGLGAGLGAGLFLWGDVGRSTATEATVDGDGGAGGDSQVAEGEAGADGSTRDREVDIRRQGQAGGEDGEEGGTSDAVGEREGVWAPREVKDDEMQGRKRRDWGGGCGCRGGRSCGRGQGRGTRLLSAVDVERVDMGNVGGWDGAWRAGWDLRCRGGAGGGAGCQRGQRGGGRGVPGLGATIVAKGAPAGLLGGAVGRRRAEGGKGDRGQCGDHWGLGLGWGIPGGGEGIWEGVPRRLGSAGRTGGRQAASGSVGEGGPAANVVGGNRGQGLRYLVPLGRGGSGQRTGVPHEGQGGWGAGREGWVERDCRMQAASFSKKVGGGTATPWDPPP